MIPCNPLYFRYASKPRVISGVDPASPRLMQEGYPSGKRPQLFGMRTSITTNNPPARPGPVAAGRPGSGRGVEQGAPPSGSAVSPSTLLPSTLSRCLDCAPPFHPPDWRPAAAQPCGGERLHPSAAPIAPAHAPRFGRE